MSDAIARLVERLSAMPVLTSETLAGALADASITIGDVTRWVRFDPTNYRRNLVARGDRFELRLLCWLPSQRSALHGHDGSACAFQILQGVSTEIRLRETDNAWAVGAIAQDGGGDMVHQVLNLGREPVISLHAYAPPLEIDQPTVSQGGKNVVIIGGGVSGAALAIHLLAGAPEGIRISIVERRQGLGRGPAYGTSDPAFRLNVPAERMSLFPDRPLDFVDWASLGGERVSASAMLPRQLYGQYVEDRLAAAIAASRGSVWFHRAEAVAIGPSFVSLGDGTCLAPDAVVLATGNQLPAAPPAFDSALLRSGRVIGDPWSDTALATIRQDEAVMICGTGLTAVDVLLALRSRGHRAPIVAMSRRGLLPQSHLPTDAPPAPHIEIDRARLPLDVGQLSRWLRGEARALEARGVSWQHLIDAVRPHAAWLWGELPAAQKQRFMRRLRPYWESFRHRAAPEALASLDEMRADGRLSIVPATVVTGRVLDEHVEIGFTPRGGTEMHHRNFDRVVLCTGPQTDVRLWTSALFRHLLQDGHLRADPLGLGVVTDSAGRAIDADGRPSGWLYTLGALRQPDLWESTSAPELVKQAQTLARRLLEPATAVSAPDPAVP